MSNPKSSSFRIPRLHEETIKKLSKRGVVDVSGLTRTDKAGLASIGLHSGLFHYNKKVIGRLELIQSFEIISCSEDFIKIAKK